MWTKSNVQNLELTKSGLVRNSQTNEVIDGYIAGRGKRQYRMIPHEGNVYYLHHLMAETFIGNRPSGHVINHINTNKLDNRLENLEYLPHSKNIVWMPQVNETLTETMIVDALRYYTSDEKLSINKVCDYMNRKYKQDSHENTYIRLIHGEYHKSTLQKYKTLSDAAKLKAQSRSKKR